MDNECIRDLIEPPIHDLPDVEQVLGKYHLQPIPISPSGFMIADMQGFIQKYENVVKCLEEGLSNKQTAKKCKVSQTTVHNVKRCLRNLGNGKLSVA
jgi:DNA-binding NarL/FixJ family response regulator